MSFLSNPSENASENEETKEIKKSSSPNRGKTNTQLVIKPNTGKIDVKLFVGQISKNWNEEDVTKFFSKFGEILESQIIKDNRTGSHKGCAFVKFASMTKADEAIKNLANVYLPGSNAPLQLRWAEGEIERLGLAGLDEKQTNKLFVGSIPKVATDQNLRDIFSQYGTIDELHLMKESDGSSKGCAFIKFQNKESAILAIKILNAQAYLLDANKPIEVRFADKKKQSNPIQQTKNNKINNQVIIQ